jgi:hypothetical protein
LPGKTCFTEEVFRSKYCDDGFLPPLRDDGELDLALLDKPFVISEFGPAAFENYQAAMRQIEVSAFIQTAGSISHKLHS